MSISAAALLVVLAVPHLASAEIVQQFTFSGKSAYAGGITWSDCEGRAMNVFATDGRTVRDGVRSGSSARVNINSYNYCTGEALDAWGDVELTASAFTIDARLNAAHLELPSVTVTDIYTGATTNLSVSLSWAATTEATTQRSSQRYTWPNGTWMMSRYNGSNRQASMSGSVSDGTVNWAVVDDSYAELWDAKHGSLEFHAP